MQNIIILMTWLTCPKPLKFHVPSLQNITAAKLILVSRWGVDWNSMFGQQLLYSILKIDVKMMQDLKENSSEKRVYYNINRKIFLNIILWREDVFMFQEIQKKYETVFDHLDRCS